MAFDIKRFTRVSLADNTGLITLQDSSLANGPGLFTYASADDTIAEISAAGYFNAEAAIYCLNVGDVIIAEGSDASNMLVVATVDRSASPKTITVDSFTPAGTVATANIEDGAVTAAKLASDAVTTAKILNANVTTAKIADAAVTSAKLSALTVQYATVAISASEFNGMYATPKLLVAAGGADTLLVLDKVQLLMTYDSAAYAAGGVAAVQYDSTANGAGVIASSTLAAATFQATASTGWNFNSGVVAETFSTCVNKGLYLSNVTGAFTTGDSDMVAHIWYKEIPSA